MNAVQREVPTFRPLVEACRDCGISRTVAYELVNSGQLETFKIGARRYVLVDSLRTLPSRMESANSRTKAAR